MTLSAYLLLVALNVAGLGLLSLPNDEPTPPPVPWSETGETQMERNDW